MIRPRTTVSMKKQICLLALLFLILLPVFGQERATPRRGEGITTFLKRHERGGATYQKEFIELNRKKLGKDEQLKLGVVYTLPPLRGEKKAKAEAEAEAKSTEKPASAAKGVIHEPLFGKALASVKPTSNRLSNACFYIVSGHGGPDPGAIGKVGKKELHEDEYAYDIALRLARNLMLEGAEVRLIIQDAEDGIRDDSYLANSKREKCMGDEIPLNQVKRLQQRCDKINAHYRKDRKKYHYCRAIFIHVDSRSKRQQTDVFFYHATQKADSKRLANTMKRTFESKYDKHQPNRGFSGTVSGRNLFVLSHTTPTSVFVELGNLQNSFDQQRFVMSSNRQALAKWLTDGFIQDARQ